MIRVIRPDAPSTFAQSAATELAKAIAYYRVKRNHRRAYPFRAYKNKEVVATLNQIFAFKCAYCESKYEATQPVAIEHYRPKGRVVEGRKKLLGYYWLASDWRNLLPSCTDCNSPRKQQLPDGKIETSGKGNQFPLKNPHQRATKEGEEKREKPLLLDPCAEDVTKHLSFLDDGVVIPRRGSAKGRESIRVYALCRVGLINSRRERLILIQGRIATIRRLVSKLDQSPRDRDLQQVLHEELAQLHQFTLNHQPYTAMAKQHIEGFLSELGITPENRPPTRAADSSR